MIIIKYNSKNMDNEKMKKLKIQSTCVNWIKKEMPEIEGCIFAVENNYEPLKNREKTFGLVRGVSNLLIIFNGKFYGINFVNENKKQKWWSQILIENGGKYFLIEDFESFKELIYKITKLKTNRF